MDEKPTKLDLRIARDKLLENIEPIWEQLYPAVRGTCDKLSTTYNLALAHRLNDLNSAIRVVYTEQPLGEFVSLESTLEMRLDRDGKKVIARISQRYIRVGAELKEDTPRTYRIEADTDSNKLYFTCTQQPFSATELAEHEVAEQLAHMEL